MRAPKAYLEMKTPILSDDICKSFKFLIGIECSVRMKNLIGEERGNNEGYLLSR